MGASTRCAFSATGAEKRPGSPNSVLHPMHAKNGVRYGRPDSRITTTRSYAVAEQIRQRNEAEGHITV